MKTKILCLALALMLVSSCAPKTETSATAPPSGTWTGDYGPDAERRDPVTLKLRWDNSSLRGTVEAGPRSLAVTQALFKADTGAISIEFDAQGNGRTVHYVVSGKVEGNQMSGTWSHDGQQGDFRVTKQ
ncbi:MAG TPA: hypothetical protein VKY31_10660 [Terriglobia bacterium]|nr:hypothetical protein [Terriglobia bacterium]